jgi:hypothetical protein
VQLGQELKLFGKGFELEFAFQQGDNTSIQRISAQKPELTFSELHGHKDFC